MALTARSRRVEADVDLLALAGGEGIWWSRGRHGFAARGAATTVDVDGTHDAAAAAAAVAAALADIAIDDGVEVAGSGPVALGALPFDRHASGTLVVPELLVARAEDGTRWVTTVLPSSARAGDHDRLVAAALDAPPATAPVDEPTSFEVRAARPLQQWCTAVAAARDELRGGVGDKVVLAREVTVRADRDLPVRPLLDRLQAAHPGCILFSVQGFVGASPELLVARHGDVVSAHPMAGTAPRAADPTADARLAAGLLASSKDRAEHRYTIDMVHDTLLPYCSYLDEEAEPSVVALANVQHLGTRVEGRLSEPAASVVELMGALHPTPAVCGLPRERALQLIGRHERLDRGRYAGPVGWVDRHGNGAFAVGIRSAELQGPTARLFAGVGVVADSDPAAELAETRDKLQAMLTAVLRP